MTKALWTSEEIALATGGDVNAPFMVMGGVSIDTRSLEPGDLFVALEDQRDGHDFAGAAYAAGAAGALVSRDIEGGAFVKVGDTLEALEALGISARMRSGAVRTAVTGSVGKTSVKDMLARIYRGAGPAHWSVKSFNNHWGVPLSLARMPEKTERAVFEIGMSTPGEIAPRSRMVRPHIGIITRIAGAHLEGLGSLDAVAEEKSAIFAGLEAGGTFILCADDPYLDFLSDRARTFCPTGNLETFGRAAGATARITDYETGGERSRITVEILGQPVSVDIQAVGEHWASNIAVAMLAASRTGLSLSDCADALTGYSPPPGRGNTKRLTLPDGGSVLLIDDAYNANPASMRAALGSLDGRVTGRRILALGEMLEIGETSDAEHAGLAEIVGQTDAAMVFLAGDKMTHLSEALPAALPQAWATDASELWDRLRDTLQDGDVVLIKGSNASGMSTLADRLRQWSEETVGHMMGDAAESSAGVGDAV